MVVEIKSRQKLKTTAYCLVRIHASHIGFLDLQLEEFIIKHSGQIYRHQLADVLKIFLIILVGTRASILFTAELHAKEHVTAILVIQNPVLWRQEFFPDMLILTKSIIEHPD